MADIPSNSKITKEQIDELHALVDTMASSLATMKGNQS
jgi:hypothetical protein